MAMIVKSNLEAVHTLTLLNNNSKAAQKSLRQVATGVKISDAQDDASVYSISERMRVKIRALDQANQNVQNGSALLKIGEGGIDNIVEELRSLKELAINAANDSNTDEDRRTIQKEFLQRMDTINDIATTTAYNGKRLLDGTYDPKKERVDVPGKALQIVKTMMSSLNETTLSGVAAFDEAISKATGNKFLSTNELVNQFMSDLNNSSSYTDFLENHCSIILNNDDTGAITGSDAGGDTTKTAESIVPEQVAVTSWGVPTAGSTTTIEGLTIHWPTTGVDGAALTDKENHILAGLNSDWIEQSVKLVSESFGMDFKEDGTTVKDISVTFENNSTNNRLAAVGYSYNPTTGKADSLTLIVNMHYYNDIDMTSEDGATSNPSAGYLDRTIAHEFTHAVMAANIDNFASLPMYLKEGAAELVHGIDDERPGIMEALLTTRKNELEGILNGSIDGTTGKEYTSGEDPYAAGYMLLRYLANQEQTDSTMTRNTRYNPLVIHSGDRANHSTNIFIADMHTKSLGAGKLFNSSDELINSSDIARYNALSYDSKKQAEWLETLKAAENKTLDDISVTTRENANIAIRVIDGALEYALDQASTLGAYLNRLEYTADNVTTMTERVQASESTIRDADMAKAMTDYTKYNVLQQAAQAMLAQANQNPNAVLGLLR